MKGNEKVVEALNMLLADELTAINQYIVHAEMCENWGYDRLHQKTQKRAVQEMKHAELLIRRILFLEGTPVVGKLNRLHIGATVPEELENDRIAEVDAIKAYNVAIRTAVEAADNGTRDLLEANLRDEEGHLDWLEAQKDQIAQMGLPGYLAEQIREES